MNSDVGARKAINDDQNSLNGDILIVDDEIANLKLLDHILKKAGYQVRPAKSPQIAIDSATSMPPGLILLDIKMPEIDGFEVCSRLKEDPRTSRIPIIFLSALQSTKDKIRGFEVGGVDYIVKPFQEEEVLARVHTHIELHNLRLNLEELVARRSEELATSEAHYRGLVDNQLVGVFNSTLDGRLVFINDAFARMFDFEDREVALEHGALDRWKHPEDRDHMLNELRQHGELVNFEAETLTHTKRTAHVIFSAKLIGENIIGMVMDLTRRKETEANLLQAHIEIKKLQEQLLAESAYLQEEIKLEHNFENIIGNSDALQYCLFKVQQVAETDSTVLILGESGTGKELIARAIHHHSSRQDRPLIKINCATLPAHLIESELFGHERGSFTGAVARHTGRFEVADGSTLFLDEIGEMPIELQPKLLRAIEDGEFERLGSTKTMKVDVRIIAATNRDLEKDASDGLFRKDLWYRLNVFPITMPPLRDRIEDIPLIAHYYLDLFTRKLGRNIESIPVKVMQKLQRYNWPGNVRELQNVIERAVIGTSGSKLQLFEVFKSNEIDDPQVFRSLNDMERDYIVSVLEKTNWKVSGNDSASEILGLDRSTLRARMKKLGIKK